ncbi:MAG TPA: hypothetical protein VNL70_10430 [Tepidisphaeraceae bacterium]|nr:hypothetical protein [Tepidisphaeraceae bacterium]
MGVWFLFALLAVRPAGAATFYSFHIGNSLTVDSKPEALSPMLSWAQAGSASVDMHVRGGATLDYLWNNPTDRSLSGYFAGPWPDALRNYTWNAVSLEPFIKPIAGPDGDAQRIVDFMNYMKTANPANAQTQVYILARWPETGWFSPTYSDAWSRTYSGAAGGDVALTATASFFDQLLTAVRAAQPQDMKPVLLIPAGHVIAEIDRRARAGKLGMLTNIAALYRDYIHLGEVGSFVTATTIYATYFGQDPTGMPVPSQYFPNVSANLDAALVRGLQETVWSVVSSMPDATGVPEPVGLATMLLLGLMARRTRRSIYR